MTTALLTDRDGKTTWTATVLHPSREGRNAALDLKPVWTGAAESRDRLAEPL